MGQGPIGKTNKINEEGLDMSRNAKVAYVSLIGLGG